MGLTKVGDARGCSAGDPPRIELLKDNHFFTKAVATDGTMAVALNIQIPKHTESEGSRRIDDGESAMG